MSFGLIGNTKGRVRKGGNLARYCAATDVAYKRDSILIDCLNLLSSERHRNRLRFEFAAGRGAGRQVPVWEAVKDNTALNRIRGGERGLGYGIICMDVTTNRSVFLHPRVCLKESELSDRVLTTESIRDQDNEQGILYEHWIIAVLADRSLKPVRYGLWSFQELLQKGRVRDYFRKRRTNWKANLRMRLTKFRPDDRSSGDFGLAAVGTRGLDPVAFLIRVLNE